MFRRRSDGADAARKVRAWNRGGGPTDWSPDCKSAVVYQTQEVNTLNDLWVLPMQDNTEPFPLVASEFDDTEGVLSPDRRWLGVSLDRRGSGGDLPPASGRVAAGGRAAAGVLGRRRATAVAA